MTPTQYFTDDEEEDMSTEEIAFLKGIRTAVETFKIIIAACPFYLSYDAGKWLVETIEEI